MKTLTESIKNKTALIAIIGLGYVGLPLALRYSERGYKVIGIDLDSEKVQALKVGESYIEHIPANSIQAALDAGLTPTADFSRLRAADAIILCVPTPLNKYREPDMTYVLSTTESILPYLRAGQVVSLESTTYPGTTEEELLPRIESSGLKVGEDIFLVYSPEREDPGNPNYETRTIPRICGGVSDNCLAAGMALYSAVIDKVIPVNSTKTAELTKLLENIHRAVNIGLVNEMKIIADKMDIDIYEVINAAATKPFGFTPYYPGPGLGGHCIPIDPFYLTWKAREYGLHTRFIELAGEINRAMPDWVITKLMDALNNQRKPVSGSRILVLGIAYKPDVDDMRESPAVELIELLLEKGAKVSYSDPHIPVFPKMREHHLELKSIELSAESIKGFDCVLIATNHSLFDYALIKQHAGLIVDCRGVYKESFPTLVKA